MACGNQGTRCFVLKTFNFINICIIRKQIVKNRQAYIQNVPTSWPKKHQLKDPSKIDGTGLVSQEIILQMIRLAEGIYIKKSNTPRPLQEIRSSSVTCGFKK